MKKIILLLFAFIFPFCLIKAQNGTISTVAGENIGNNVTATAFGINPYSVAPDKNGNLYIADASNHIIHELNIVTGKLTVVAGNGSYGYSGDGGQATDAQFVNPVAVALDRSNNNLYVVDESDLCVRKIDLTSGIITTVAGNGYWGFSGDGGPATAAEFKNPIAIAIDTANNLYISDYSNNRIRKVSNLGIISTIAGYDSTGYNKDSIPADSARLNGPSGIALDKAGNIYFVDQNNCRIRVIKASTDTIYTISGGKAGFSGDGGPAAKAQFWYPLGITLDTIGNIYISDTYDNRIREINIANDTINTIYGTGYSGYIGDGGPASAAELFQPHYISFDAQGNLFIADMGNNRIREVLSTNKTITTLAGDGVPGYNGNNISAQSTQLSYPTDVALDKSDNIYVAEAGNNMVREIDNAGNILKIAGNGTGGFSGDGGPAGKAQFSGIDGICLDTANNIYIADEYNNRIREVNYLTNTVKTIAGNGTGGFSGDNGLPTNAELHYPVDVAIDSKGNIFIADMVNDRIREISATTKRIKTVAGNGYNANNWSGGYSGDGGPATAAELYQPQSIAVDNSNNLYIADTWNDRVRKVNLTTGIITTVAGTGNWNYTGDGGPATAADLGIPTGVKVDAYGNLYIADFYNNVVRMVSVWDSTITTVAGSSVQSFSGDGGPAINAALDLAHNMAFDPSGNLYIADYGNNRIRRIDAPLGINTVGKKGSISVYPNPADKEVNISVSGFSNEPSVLQITDITGRMVIQRNMAKVYPSMPIYVDVSGLSLGIYFVSLKNSGQNFTAKIVKE